jgi:hypothetical protein
MFDVFSTFPPAGPWPGSGKVEKTAKLAGEASFLVANSISTATDFLPLRLSSLFGLCI